MRAVVLDGAGEPALGEVAEPDGSRTLVDVVACGLCGTDVQKIGRAAPGTVLGHEVVARTDDGRRVALVHHLPCGECERCRSGHETTCERFPEPTILPGGFAERAAAAQTIALPDEVDDATGTFAEPLACVLRAVERIPRGRVLVVGCGFAGLLFVQALVRRGDDVLAADPLAHRLELALGYGAQPLDDGGVNAAVLCAHRGLDGALAALEPGGTLLLFSWLVDPAAIDFEAVLRRELTLVGSCSATPAAMRDAIALLPQLDPIPTVMLPLERFADGLELYRSHEAVKVVFTP
jgi:L-iditol 2-dehydrogenase